jgi:predicted esterase
MASVTIRQRSALFSFLSVSIGLLVRPPNGGSAMSTAAAAAVTSSSAAGGPIYDGALIFLHGLGDSPAGWSDLATTMPQNRPRLSRIKYVFPQAPTIPIGINGDMEMPVSGRIESNAKQTCSKRIVRWCRT